MKPITISAMVAGVQAGRISAVVFIFSRSFRWGQPVPAAPFDMGREKWRFKMVLGKTRQAVAISGATCALTELLPQLYPFAAASDFPRNR
jgi:hypothetical protein